MNIYLWHAAIKGVVEGITEFLPISSTGHLVLVRHLFPLTGDPARVAELDNLFDVVIQLPAILAIVLLYRRKLWGTATTVLTNPDSRHFWSSVLVAFLPAAVIGFLLKDLLDGLMQAWIVAVALIVGGIILLGIERKSEHAALDSPLAVPFPKAALIGLFQCLSMIPGTSRSGATIIGARVLGLSRTAAAEFSFFLAIPTMVGAFTLKFAKHYDEIQWATDGWILLMGSVTSFLSAWAVVALLMRFLRTHKLSVFGWYRIALGILVLLLAR